MGDGLQREGWVGLMNSKKWHYFREGRSLCGRWMYVGGQFELGNNDSSDNCAACKKKLKRETTVPV